MTQKKTNIVAIVTMCFIFAMISFVTNMAAPFGTIWKNQYEWAGMMGNMMNFAAYLFMGIPAGKMLVKFGYKKTTLAALATGFIGIVIQWLSKPCIRRCICHLRIPLRCIHLRFLRMYAEHGSEPYAQHPRRWRKQG